MLFKRHRWSIDVVSGLAPTGKLGDRAGLAGRVVLGPSSGMREISTAPSSAL
jgi:hypothetical protein